MRAYARVPLGAPDLYAVLEPALPRLGAQRMDVCAFVGVAPRGPAFEPVVDARHPADHTMVTDPARPLRRSVAVAVSSFDEYRRLFGAFEGPGLLPHAVASFFDQGGRRAYVIRIAHDPALDPPGSPRAQAATGTLAGAFTAPLAFRARNVGTWGDGLRLELAFDRRPLAFTLDGADLTVARGDDVAVGSLLRLTDSGGAQQCVVCRTLTMVHDAAAPLSRYRLGLEPLPALVPASAELVEARLTVRDGAGNGELFDRLGLAAGHPRALASVLCAESRLVWPDAAWAGQDLWPASAAVELLSAVSSAFAGGADAWGSITAADFFDPRWSPAEEQAGDGITALAACGDATHLVAPDLYVPAQWAAETEFEETRVDRAGAEFARCITAEITVVGSATPPSALTGLILDPRRGAELAQIGALQRDVVAFCEDLRAVQPQVGLIALLDVPPGLSQGRIEAWRSRFDSAWCAAYHPWLIAARRRELGADRLTRLPPSAVAAGIVARREAQFGIQHGPANELAREVVALAEVLPEGRVDALHPQGVNCWTRDADGIRLVAARTLSRERDWRQLSVRRLVLMLERTLLAETQWAVFEPNGPRLWRDLRHAIENLLRRLFRAGAFAGATEAESFFVRVRDERALIDRGQLVVEIGVAPAEPIEFIVLVLARRGDGTLTIEESA